jgi:ABC-type antimicrobial peptide transport system permease subunit
MILRNLLRRKGRTILTLLGISLGVAAIIALGALAEGLEAGYSSVLGGSQADFVLSEPDSFDIIMSSVDESIGPELAAMPEVAEVSGMVQGLVQAEDAPYFFVFAYTDGSFALDRFNVVKGVGLDSREAERARGKPLLLGSAAAESLNKEVGDTIRLSDSVFRVVGIYETGEAFEEGGCVLRLKDAQELLGMQHQVSAFYIKVRDAARDPSRVERLRTRIERRYPDLSLSTTEEMGNRAGFADSIKVMVWGVVGLAIVIGSISMMNAQLMSVMERTHEIGVLRAVGWSGWRVMRMILGESILIGLLGGAVGVGMGWGMLLLFKGALAAFGTSTSLDPKLLGQAFTVVFSLGLFGGLYPAYRASRMQPVEALRYEGGTLGQHAARLPVGGMPVQNLWRRKARTFLTLGVIGITVGAIMLLNSILIGSVDMMNDWVGGSEIVIRQAEAADTSVAFIDQEIGDRIAAMSGVRAVSGVLFTAVMDEQQGMFILMGYDPHQPAIEEFNVVEGQPIHANRQIMVGRQIADAQNIQVGESITLREQRFRVVGIYETSVSAYELGGVVTLHDAQTFMGKPRKVTFFMVDLLDPNQAKDIAATINAEYPEVHASLSGDFAEQLPDMQNSFAMSNGIATLAIFIGGVGVMNTMLMAVLERTREVGTLRALGWRRRAILWLILRESVVLSVVGGIVGILIALGLAAVVRGIPTWGDAFRFSWEPGVFISSLSIALALGLAGGLYPAFRATRMQPVEALRYE